MLLGGKPNNSDINIFGNDAFIQSHKAQKAGRLSDRTIQGVYVGSRNELSSIYIPTMRKIVETRHVYFDERVQPAPAQIEM